MESAILVPRRRPPASLLGLSLERAQMSWLSAWALFYHNFHETRQRTFSSSAVAQRLPTCPFFTCRMGLISSSSASRRFAPPMRPPLARYSKGVHQEVKAVRSGNDLVELRRDRVRTIRAPFAMSSASSTSEARLQEMVSVSTTRISSLGEFQRGSLRRAGSSACLAGGRNDDHTFAVLLLPA